MAISFTPQQQKVIDLRNCNILVSAAAGSGKTAVLVERIVQRVCSETEPVDIDRLLIVTFTNAAAAEMRERISAGISRRLEENPDSEHIQRQAALIHNAQITTIDSFCLFLLRNHFNEIGLDPAFRIADEGEVKLMQQEVLQELMEDSYAQGGEEFRYCVEFFCPGGREKVLEQHILNLSRYAASFPFPEEWLEARRRDYGENDSEQLCQDSAARYLLEHVRRMGEGCLEKLRQVKELCEQPDGPYMYGELVDGEIDRLEALQGCCTLSEYGERLGGISFGRLPVKKDDTVSLLKRELAKKLRSQVKECIQGLSEKYFATPLELAAEQGAACRGPVGTLIDLTLSFDRRMQEKKQEKKVIDFSDMEHNALAVLLERKDGRVAPSRVALEYRQHFEEVLVDEYQDSNLVQEYLLRAVSREEPGHCNLFMVGDVKQSIYRFRLARPELFLEKYHSYSPEEGDCRRIDLSRNFRSREQVVNAVNEIFEKLMQEQTGGLVYDERAALYPGASYPAGEGCQGEFLLVEKLEEGELNARQAEALAIAGRIRELRESFQVTDKESGMLRPVKYSDIVILLRSNSGWDEEFKEVLEKEGIPVYISSRTGYFSATEVQELLQLLRVLDNPSQDIPLFGVMKSLFGGFTEEELSLIRSSGRRGRLYGALKDFAGEEGQPRELREKCAGFLEKLDTYRKMTAYLSVRELVTRLVNDYDYLNYVTALPAGGKRRANVEMLFTKASDFEKTSYSGLFHFIRYMEQLEKYDVDYGEADTLDENADVVRIMSIHKSKGLEFPVAFAAGLGKRFNMQDVNQPLLLDMDLGLAVDYVEPEKRIRNKTLRRMALGAKLRRDSLAEELRILYVALTRAREKLIMTAAAEKAEEKWEMYRELGAGRLSFLDFVEGAGILDYLLPILPETSVEVRIVKEEELSAAGLTEQVRLSERLEKLNYPERFSDEEGRKRLQERLEAVYPFEGLKNLYTKTTVSELKIAAMADKDEEAYHTFEEKEVLPYIPAFRKEKQTISGTVRGNAYHRVMELIDFEKILGTAAEGEFPGSYEEFSLRLDGERLREALKGFLENQVKEGRLEPEYMEAVREKAVCQFLSSELGYRMWRASRAGGLYREQPFVLGIAAERLGEKLPKGETVLIQGIIDVFFREEDGLVLLDYKTDAVSSLEELWKRYETQLDYYGEALEKLMKQPVKERLLYSFHLGKY